MKQGEIYRIKMDSDDGITPKNEDTYRYKYIIIVGDDGNNLYAAAVTNTKDHPLIPIKFQYPLKINDYRCYVNCYKIYKVDYQRIHSEDYKGDISCDDLNLIKKCINESPKISIETLKKFKIYKPKYV